MAARAGRDRYKERFSVLSRHTRITRSLNIKLKKLNGKIQEYGWGGGVVLPPWAAQSRKIEYFK